MNKFPENSEFSNQFEDFSPTPPEGAWEGITESTFKNKGILGHNFATYTAVPPASAWGNIEKILHPKRRRKVIAWWWSGVAALFIVGVLSYSFINSFESGQTLCKANTIKTILETDNCADQILQTNEVVKNVNSADNISESKVVNAIDNIVYSEKKKEVNEIPKPTSELVETQEKIKSRSTNLDILNSVEALSYAIIVPGENHYPKGFNTLDEEDMPQVDEQNDYLAANFGTSNGVQESEVSFQNNQRQDVSFLTATEVSQPLSFKRLPPIQLGFDFRKSIGKRAYLTFGINQTRMVKESNKTTFNDEIQIKESYIGAPIAIGVNWLKRKKLTFNSSLGHIQEAKIYNKYKNITQDYTNRNWSFNPQFGVEIATGFNYNIYKNLGLSSSFSVSHYYFTPSNSYWNEKIVWPKMQFSLTYSL